MSLIGGSFAAFSMDKESNHMRYIIRSLLGCLLVLISFSTAPVMAEEAQFSQYESKLIKAKFSEKSIIIRDWIASDSQEALGLVKLMLNSQLYFHKKEKKLYRVDKAEKGGEALRLSDNQSVVIEKKRDYKRVSINNTLRSEFSALLSFSNLNSDDADQRKDAALNLIGTPSSNVINRLRILIQSEDNPQVLEALKIVLAVEDLNSSDKHIVSDAISLLRETLEPAALGALNQFTERSSNAELVTLAETAIKDHQERASFYSGVETVYFGLSLGSVLVLAGIGLAITFGVMGVINMAHGELIMIGAYTTYVVQLLMPNFIEYSLLVAIPAAFLVSGLVGIAIERGVIRFLYGRPLETLLATFGISLVLQQAVRSVFSPLNRSVETPSWMSGSLEINPLLSLTESRLYIIFFCLFVFFTLLWVMKRTRLGLQVRAVSQNRAMARAMGVRSEWVDAMTFGLGSGVAGVAGVALSQLTNVGPNMGQAYIIDSFMVVVFGGVGNLWGTLVAGISLGLANKIMEPWAGAVLAKIFVLIFIILFIQKRPRGLFPQRGRAAED